MSHADSDVTTLVADSDLQDNSTFTTGWSWASSALSVVSSTVSRSTAGATAVGGGGDGDAVADATDGGDDDDDDDESLFEDAAEIPSDLGRGAQKKLGTGKG